MSSTCVSKRCVQVMFSICYVIKVHFLFLCQTDSPKFSFQWLISRFPRLFTSKFIHKNNKFRFKSEFKRQAHICKFAALWAKNNPEKTHQFRKQVSIWDYKNCFHPVSLLAMIVLGLAKQVSIQKLSFIFMRSQYAAMQKLSEVTAECKFSWMSVFDVHFSSFPFRLFGCKSTFVSLEAACKTIPGCSRRANFTTSREIHRFLAS